MTLIPAFWTADQAERVKDVTGAGNSFMGGLMVGLAEGKDIVEASRFGAVSSSFAVEAIGIPTLNRDDGTEKWNDGPDPYERLNVLAQRESLQL
ncbi:hypothetical protein BC829DRAFT_361509 [Chytridium lagenaria]|nr:hypothetical protein BC829DRAFT_361509 [Chytridium lagenaria]